MDYQLTLKFPYYDLDDYKSIITLEEKLAKQLGKSARVDGHYAGSELMSIFVITSQPLETFVLVLQVVKNEGLLATLSILCKAVNGHQFARLWPLKFEESSEESEEYGKHPSNARGRGNQ
ncbi:MAG: hypothetical protein PVI06_11845 [Desulfobacterales bacterium]|jgi:hypothetical protein